MEFYSQRAAHCQILWYFGQAKPSHIVASSFDETPVVEILRLIMHGTVAFEVQVGEPSEFFSLCGKLADKSLIQFVNGLLSPSLPGSFDG